MIPFCFILVVVVVVVVIIIIIVAVFVCFVFLPSSSFRLRLHFDTKLKNLKNPRLIEPNQRQNITHVSLLHPYQVWIR